VKAPAGGVRPLLTGHQGKTIDVPSPSPGLDDTAWVLLPAYVKEDRLLPKFVLAASIAEGTLCSLDTLADCLNVPAGGLMTDDAHWGPVASRQGPLAYWIQFWPTSVVVAHHLNGRCERPVPLVRELISPGFSCGIHMVRDHASLVGRSKRYPSREYHYIFYLCSWDGLAWEGPEIVARRPSDRPPTTHACAFPVRAHALSFGWSRGEWPSRFATESNTPAQTMARPGVNRISLCIARDEACTS